MIPYPNIPSWHLGPLHGEAFGILLCIGFLLGAYLAKRRAEKVGLNPTVVVRLAWLSVVFGLLSAHLTHLLSFHPEELRHNPWNVFKVWSGMSSFGGFIGAAVAIYVYLKRNKLEFYPYADVMVFGLFPGWLFGRLGCYTAHDHPGRPTDFILGVKYPNGPRHDLGFYEVLLSMFWIPLLYYLGRNSNIDNPPRGSIYSAMMIAYSIPRFFLDFLRSTDLRYQDARYFGLTPSQYACVGCTLLGTSFFLRPRWRLQAA